MVENPKLKKSFPALRCIMGDWTYYITYMKFSDVAAYIKRATDVYQNKGLSDMIQRELKVKSRAPEIARYLVERKERFFSSIVVGVYGGTANWYPIRVKTSPVLGTPDIDEDAQESIGLVELSGDQDLYAIDGQHRVEGIKQALGKAPALANEDLSVIFVAYMKDPKGRMHTRQLFSTLNRYATPVSKGEIVALNEDNAFAITTRRLVEDFQLLNSTIDNKTGFVSFRTTAPVPASDQTHLTTVLALHDIVATIHRPILDSRAKQQMKDLEHRRPDDKTLDLIYEEQVKYWDLLRRHFPEYDELFRSVPSDRVAGKYRENGGHLMFRPIGQLAFARAVRILRDRGDDLAGAISSLAKAPMRLDVEPWRFVLWNPNTSRLNTKVSPLLTEGILLAYLDQEPRRRDFDVVEEYKKVIGDVEPGATVPF